MDNQMTDIIELAKQAGFLMVEDIDDKEIIISDGFTKMRITDQLTKFAQLLQQGEAMATIIQHPHIDAKEIEYRHTDLDKYPPGTKLFAGAPTSQAEHKFIMDMYFSYEELDLSVKDTDSIYLKGVKQLIKVIKDEQADYQRSK